MDSGLIIDLFAGGGGASSGIALALGRDPDIAINHDAVAVAMHRANHPETMHLHQDVWQVLPRQATKGDPVALLWASPDCTHFSKAKGGPPIRDVKRRDLAWVVVRWAEDVRPRVIILENVEEFKTWGPLDENSKIIASQKGSTFRAWVRRLRRLGYAVEFQCLRACDYGAPTSRKRLFMIARCDGEPIVWPAPSHGDPKSHEVSSGQFLPWRTAAEIIDWSIPCPSIFERKKPLAENTQKRIAQGIKRYVIESANPFIVTYYGPKREDDFRGRGIDEPIPTQSTENRFGLIVPTLVTNTSGHAPSNINGPLSTLTTGNHEMLIVPHLQRQFGKSIGNGSDEPLGTITAGFGGKTALVTAFMAQHNGGMVGHEMTEPVSTVTHRGTQQQLVIAHLSKHFGKTTKSGEIDGNNRCLSSSHSGRASEHRSCRENLEKLQEIGFKESQISESKEGRNQTEIWIPRGDQLGKREALHDSGSPACLDCSEGTDTGKDGHKSSRRPKVEQQSREFGVCDQERESQARIQNETSAAFEIHSKADFEGSNRTGEDAKSAGFVIQPNSKPIEHFTDNSIQGHAQSVASFIIKYFGEGGQWSDCGRPLHTITAKDRMSLVTVMIQGEPYVIADIGMRMLSPRELFRAQGFDDSYRIDIDIDGKRITKGDQVRLCGNSVCPPIAEALVKANLVEDVGQMKRQLEMF